MEEASYTDTYQYLSAYGSKRTNVTLDRRRVSSKCLNCIQGDCDRRLFEESSAPSHYLIAIVICVRAASTGHGGFDGSMSRP